MAAVELHAVKVEKSAVATVKPISEEVYETLAIAVAPFVLAVA